MSRCDFENSQISAQDTVGVAGDDIMFHILVSKYDIYFSPVTPVLYKISCTLDNDRRDESRLIRFKVLIYVNFQL